MDHVAELCYLEEQSNGNSFLINDADCTTISIPNCIDNNNWDFIWAQQDVEGDWEQGISNPALQKLRSDTKLLAEDANSAMDHKH